MILDYYTTIITVIWIALIILCMLVYDNNRMKAPRKRAFYITYVLIFWASFFEWAGIKLSGNTNVPVFLLHFVKCCDYILTPIAGASFVGQMRIRSFWIKILNGIIGFNVLFQFISLFTGWMIRIDSNHVYHHGSLYFIYIVEYLLIVATVVIQFRIYGRRFKKENRFTLYLIMCFVLLGIFIQEFVGGEIRTAYLTLTIGAFMMYIHSTEYVQQESDEYLYEQQIQIKTDALTGLMSRHAYSQKIREFTNGMPGDLAVFSIDINGLKTINDTLGHEAGDELICGAAQCIRTAFEDSDECYRTGGDEFIVFTHMIRPEAINTVKKLYREQKAWKGDIVPSISMSIGFALLSENSELSCEALIREADKEMYKVKNNYYRSMGLEKRKT